MDAEPAPPTTHRVLIVDDVEVQRELVKRFLRGTSFEVVGEASDGAQAIQATKALKPDVVLLDLNMPILSGLDALPAILHAHPGATVIVFSDYERHQMEPIVSKLGAVAYLEKNLTSPLLPDALVGVMNSIRQTRPRGHKPTILLVDDDEENLDSLSEFFAQRLPCKVLTASSAQQGLDILQKEPIDLIISDHSMPEMTGLDFLLVAKKMLPGVPRVMLTAYGDATLRDRATLEAEVKDFLSRGASLSQIEASLRRILLERRDGPPAKPVSRSPV